MSDRIVQRICYARDGGKALTVNDGYFRFDGGCLHQRCHHYGQVLHKGRSYDLAHPGPRTDEVRHLKTTQLEEN